jgi:carboxyl-terminal processing protease
MKKITSFCFILFFVSLSLSAVSASNERSFRISKNLSIFNSLFRELDLFYVDTLNYDKVVKTTIDNMLMKLDPYTVYYARRRNR